MNKSYVQKIVHFLKNNGFEHIERCSYANDMCNVVFEDGDVTIANNRGDVAGYAVNIFQLIGILTYYGFIDKNYKQ